MGHGAGYGLPGGAALLVHNIQNFRHNGALPLFCKLSPSIAPGAAECQFPKVFPVDRYDIIKAAKSREVFSMRKNFGAKAFSYPQPVFIIATYNDDGSADAMNAA